MSVQRPRLIVSALLLGLALSACSGSDDPEPEPTETTATTEPEPAILHPLTGEPLPDGRPDHPVFVVKVDNTSPAAPQSGLADADLVVEQLVEGGETRLAALYYSTFPERIGHVRSLRGSDIGIAKPVEGVVVATGGASRVLSQLESADVPMRTEDGRATGFSSNPAKSRPYNRWLDLEALADDYGDAPVEGTYFEFGDGPTDLDTESVTSASVAMSSRHVREFEFVDGLWRRVGGLENTDDGFAAENLIVVKAEVVDAGYTDPGGNFVPETLFEGDGAAWIVVDGELIEGTWSKDDAADTIEFTTADGDQITIAAGRTWLMLVPDNAADPTFE